MTIPANTSALVYFPATRKEYVSEKNQHLTSVHGARFLGVKEGKAVFKLGSGDYQFEIQKQ